MISKKRQLLIIEDDNRLRNQLRCLSDEYNLIFAKSSAKVIAALYRFRPGVVLLDLGLHGGTKGMVTLQEILSLVPEIKVIVLTDKQDNAVSSNKCNALKAISLGAYDVYQDAIDSDNLKLIIDHAFHLNKLAIESKHLQEISASPLDGIVANSPQMLDVCQMARRVAPTDISVLILGASGTGKERIAQAIHKLSPRCEKNIIAINCAAIPEALLESELFGHEKGAFTGAATQKIGKIERANGGTLFLDEIGDLSLDLQAKLLRFLQERVIERLGGCVEIAVDTRIICATHQNIENMIVESRFREDLYYRISEVTLNIPSLKNRDGDIVLLAKLFLDRFNEQMNCLPRKFFSQEAIRAIECYSWPGNVRELENKIKRAMVLSSNIYICAEDLTLKPENIEPLCLNLKEAREKVERRVVRRAMFECNDNISEAAGLLGVARPTVYKLLDKYSMKVNR